ncbi:sulfite exporter TauE/SafE family protein [Actimicrobium antarcticum]|uniref:Probable membrane transporter protein n=1 Tax=Actimicrobium antarcticum TaxID=1051899 RepID=A0ABP7SRX0_9BURK
MDPAVLVLAALAAICFVAGVAKGLTGFGAALIMAPLLSMLIPPTQAAALIVLLHAMTGWQGARTWWPHVQWPRVIGIAVVALMCHQLTLPVLAQVDDVLVRRATGTLVLLLSLSSLCGAQLRNSGGYPATLAAAVASGIFTAFGGLGGPPVAYYFAGQASAATHMRANLLGYFMVLFSGAAIGLAVRGAVGIESLRHSALLAPFFVLGMMAGSRLYGRLSPRCYHYVVQLGLVGIGLFAMVR